MKKFELFPSTMAQANNLVSLWHRHHKPVQGYRFAIGLRCGGKIVGVAIVGRPVASGFDPSVVAEVTRLVTDGTPHACSALYGACSRAAKAMGFKKIQTYILESEPGTSLRAAGWTEEIMTPGGSWNTGRYVGRREDQPQGPKKRFGKFL